MTVSASPLLERQGREPFAITADGPVSVAAFLADVSATAEALPEAARLINTCDDRYRFLVGFCAAVAAGRTSLLPAARSEDACRTLAERYPGAARLADPQVCRGAGTRTAPSVPAIADDAMAAIAFTSGSTGVPQPHGKPWGALRGGSRLHAQCLGLSRATLIATVPPWHMYGLEWSALVATVRDLTLYCPPAFYPDDVRRALSSVDAPRVLVTTPVHLRAMMRSGADYPAVDTVVCATAPLDRELALEAERRLAARVLEIYGCSEAGTLAHRQPAREQGWRLFDGFELSVTDQRAEVRAAFLEGPVVLADRLQCHADGTFDLLGRWGDLVKVAGRRASLGDLTARLLSVPGVEDAVIFDPSDDGAGRLCAFVVAPGLGADEVRRRFAGLVDAAFLPRPLRVVEALPRSDTGKLTRDELLRLLGTLAR